MCVHACVRPREGKAEHEQKREVATEEDLKSEHRTLNLRDSRAILDTAPEEPGL